MKRQAFLTMTALCLVGCTFLHAAETQPATTQAALQAIRYQRTGGFAGTNDVLEITPEGLVVLQGKLMGNGKMQLSRDQLAKLAPLFADWKSLKASYPAPSGSADGFEVKIRYGTVEVSASEMNKDLPASFTAAREALEKIAADAKGKTMGP